MPLEVFRLLVCTLIDTMLILRLYSDDDSLIHLITYYGPDFLLARALLSLRRARRLCSLLCHLSVSNCVNRCSTRATSLRVCVNTRLFFISPRCCCKRRLNSFIRKSLSSRFASPALNS